MRLKITPINGCYNTQLHLLFLIFSLCTITNAFNNTTTENKSLHVYPENTRTHSVAPPSPEKIAKNRRFQDISKILGSDQPSVTNKQEDTRTHSVASPSPETIAENERNQRFQDISKILGKDQLSVSIHQENTRMHSVATASTEKIAENQEIQDVGKILGNDLLSITINGTKYNLNTTECSGGVVFRTPVEISELCSNQLVYALPSVCTPKSKEVILGSQDGPLCQCFSNFSSAVFQSFTISSNSPTPNPRVKPIHMEERKLDVNTTEPLAVFKRLTISASGSTPNARVEPIMGSRSRTLNITKPLEVSTNDEFTISVNGSTLNSRVEPIHKGNRKLSTSEPSQVSSSGVFTNSLNGSTPNSRIHPTHKENPTLTGPSEVSSSDVVTISVNGFPPNSRVEPIHMENHKLTVSNRKPPEVSSPKSVAKSSSSEELEYDDTDDASEEEEDNDIAKNPDNYYYYYLKDDRTKKDPLKDDADTNGDSNEAIHSNALRKRETDNATKNTTSGSFGRIGTIQTLESDAFGKVDEFIKETNVNLNESPYYDEFEERGEQFPENTKETLDLRTLNVMTRKEYQGDYEMEGNEPKTVYDSDYGDSRYQGTPTATPSLQEILVDVRAHIEQEINRNNTSPNGQNGSFELEQPVSQKWFFLLSAMTTVADKLVPQILISHPAKSESKLVKPLSEPDSNSTVSGLMDFHSGFLHDAKSLFSYFLKGLDDKDLGNATEDSELWKTIETSLQECAKRGEETNSTEKFTIVEKHAKFGKPYVDFDTVQLKKPRWNEQNKNYTKENLVVDYSAFEAIPESHLPPTEARINPKNWLLAELMWYAVQLAHSFCLQSYPEDNPDSFTTTFDRLAKLFDSDSVQNLWRFPSTSLPSIGEDLQRTLIILDKVNWVVHEESTLHQWLTRPRKRVKKSIRKPHDANNSPRLIAVMRPITLTTQAPVVRKEIRMTTAKTSPKVETTVAQQTSSTAKSKARTHSVTTATTIPKIATADANTSKTPIPALHPMTMTTQLPVVRNGTLTTTVKAIPENKTTDTNASQTLTPVLHPMTTQFPKLPVAKNETLTTKTKTIPQVKTADAHTSQTLIPVLHLTTTTKRPVVRNKTLTTKATTIPKIETTVAQQTSSSSTIDTTTQAKSEARTDSVTTATTMPQVETTVAQQKSSPGTDETTARVDFLPVVRNGSVTTTSKPIPKIETTVAQQKSSFGTIHITAKSEAKTDSVTTAKPMPKIKTTVTQQKSSPVNIDSTVLAKSEARADSVKTFEIWDGLAFCRVRSSENNEILPSLADIKALGSVDCKT